MKINTQVKLPEAARITKFQTQLLFPGQKQLVNPATGQNVITNYGIPIWVGSFEIGVFGRENAEALRFDDSFNPLDDDVLEVESFLNMISGGDQVFAFNLPKPAARLQLKRTPTSAMEQVFLNGEDITNGRFDSTKAGSYPATSRNLRELYGTYTRVGFSLQARQTANSGPFRFVNDAKTLNGQFYSAAGRLYQSVAPDTGFACIRPVTDIPIPRGTVIDSPTRVQAKLQAETTLVMNRDEFWGPYRVVWAEFPKDA